MIKLIKRLNNNDEVYKIQYDMLFIKSRPDKNKWNVVVPRVTEKNRFITIYF